jgi:hypothetical protein
MRLNKLKSRTHTFEDEYQVLIMDETYDGFA